MISVLLNGEPRQVPADVDVDRLLELFSLPKQRVAIEINNDVVRRVEWKGRLVQDGDKVEVVHLVGGG